MRAFIKHVARRQAIAEAVGIVEKASSSAPAFGAGSKPPSGGAVVAPFPPADAFELALWISPDRKLDLARNELLLRSISAAHYPLIFEIAGNTAWVRFTIRGHRDDEQTVRHAFKGLYPDCGIQNDANAWWKTGELSNYYEAIPSEHFARITMPDTLTDSLLWALTEWLMSIDGAVGFYQCVLQSLGPSNHWHRQLEVRHDLAFLERLVAPQSSTQRTPQQVPSGDLHSRSSELLKRVNPDLPFFAVSLRCGIIGRPKEAILLPQFLTAVRCAGQALWLAPAMPPSPAVRDSFFRCGAGSNHCLLLNSAEATVVAHILPARDDLIKRTNWPVHLGEVPPAVVGLACSPIGNAIYAGRPIPVGIPRSLRDRAVEMISVPGHGKTNLMKHIFIDDVKTGAGAVFLDPHGDAVKDLALLVPEQMRHRIVYLNPGGRSWIPCWNPLSLPLGADPARVADNFVSTIKRNSIHWGNQLEMILRNAIIGLLYLPNATFHDLYNLMRRKSPESEALRRRIVVACPDPIVRQFWETDFLTTYKEDDTKSSRNKLLRLVSGGTVSQMLAQRENRIDLNNIMETGKILLVDLSEVGDESRRFLGSFMLSLFASAARGRSSQRLRARQPFSIFADEAHLFIEGDAIQTLVTEARKFNIWSVFAHQILSQFERPQADALLTAGALLVGRTDLNDATVLAKRMQGKATAEDISTLPPYNMVGRIGADIVRFQTPPSNDRDDPAALEAIIAESHKRYYVRAADIRTEPIRTTPALDTSVDLSYDEF